MGNHSFMTFKSTLFCDHTKSLFSNLNIMRRKQFWNSNQRVSIFSPIWTPTPNISTGFGILMVVPCCTDLLTLLPTYCFNYFVDNFVPFANMAKRFLHISSSQLNLNLLMTKTSKCVGNQYILYV